MNLGVHYLSQRDDWSTPRALFERLQAEFGFTLDPCAQAHNAQCARFYTPEQDGLSRSWRGERVFMNPPYGRRIGAWVRKACRAQALVVALLPARTDTAWWHEGCMRAHEIRLIRGRLRFGDGRGSAPFPSAIVVFRWPRSVNPPLLRACDREGRILTGGRTCAP